MSSLLVTLGFGSLGKLMQISCTYLYVLQDEVVIIMQIQQTFMTESQDPS